MSGLCLQQFDLLSDECWQRVVKAQLAIDEHRRPSMDKVEITGRIIAGGFIDEVGYCDLTYQQIAEKSWNISVSMVQPCIKVWNDSGLLTTVRRSTKGQNGQSGRAPRRVFTFYNPQGLTDKPKAQIQALRVIEVKRTETRPLNAQQEPEGFDIPELKRLLAEGDFLEKKVAAIALRQAAKVGEF
ncbi:MAG: hypothetical protein CK542_04525 [Acidimicrobium sp.]|nr:MAG: hypothetical protein CK542_04525 [Acidimicrobium sp.]